MCLSEYVLKAELKRPWPIIIVRVPLSAKPPFASVARTVNVDVAAVVVVPLINPDEDSVVPAGNEPEFNVYVGATPESSGALN